MKKFLFWIPVIGFVMSMLPFCQRDLPIDKFSMFALGPWHGITTGSAIVWALYLIGVIPK